MNAEAFFFLFSFPIQMRYLSSYLGTQYLGRVVNNQHKIHQNKPPVDTNYLVLHLDTKNALAVLPAA